MSSQAENQWLLFALNTSRRSLARAFSGRDCGVSSGSASRASSSKRRTPCVNGPMADESTCWAFDWYFVM